jgi:predicted nucleic-acid-binding Zn-ribbon protein
MENLITNEMQILAKRIAIHRGQKGTQKQIEKICKMCQYAEWFMKQIIENGKIK